MSARSNDAAFWSKISRKYAANPIRNMEGYLATLERTKSHLKPTDDILEIGCGTGSTAMLLAPHVRHVTATDLAPGMIEIANEKRAQEGLSNVTFKVADVLDHASGDKAYDAVLAHNLLHLVSDLDRALDRVSSLTRPGGFFISKTVCTPERPGFRYALIRWLAIPAMQALGKAPFVRFRTAKALQAKIEQAGFTTIEHSVQAGMLPSLYLVAEKR